MARLTPTAQVTHWYSRRIVDHSEIDGKGNRKHLVNIMAVTDCTFMYDVFIMGRRFQILIALAVLELFTVGALTILIYHSYTVAHGVKQD